MLSLPFKIRRAKKELIYYGRLLVERGLTFSAFGNISKRVRDRVVIKKRGVNLGTAREGDFAVFPLLGDVKLVEEKFRNGLSSEWRMHLYTYLKNPQYEVLFHLHPFYLSILDKLNLPIEDGDFEFKYFIKDKLSILPELKPGSEELASKVAEEVGRRPILILKGHGIVVAGKELSQVYNYCTAIEVWAKKKVIECCLTK